MNPPPPPPNVDILGCIVIFRTVVQRAKAETLEGTEYWAANKGSCINLHLLLSEYFRPTPIACASCFPDNCSEKHNVRGREGMYGFKTTRLHHLQSQCVTVLCCINNCVYRGLGPLFFCKPQCCITQFPPTSVCGLAQYKDSASPG